MKSHADVFPQSWQGKGKTVWLLYTISCVCVCVVYAPPRASTMTAESETGARCDSVGAFHGSFRIHLHFLPRCQAAIDHRSVLMMCVGMTERTIGVSARSISFPFRVPRRSLLTRSQSALNISSESVKK